MTILLVDDQPQILLIASMALEFAGGFEVLTAGSATHGVAMALEHRPDLIVLDVMMPEVDGIAACRQIRANPDLAGTPVVFMTARVGEADIATYYAEGAVGVIPKPFDPRTLGDELRALKAKADAL